MTEDFSSRLNRIKKASKAMEESEKEKFAAFGKEWSGSKEMALREVVWVVLGST